MNSEALTFAPDYCSPPGETLREWMQENKPRIGEFRSVLGLCSFGIKQLIAGNMEIDKWMASRLAAATDIPSRFWLSREKRYRAFLDDV